MIREKNDLERKMKEKNQRVKERKNNRRKKDIKSSKQRRQKEKGENINSDQMAYL